MSTRTRRFLTLNLSDTECWGYDEVTLPLLLRLIDSSSPHCRRFSHTGIVACYPSSPQGLRTVGQVITGAESLRENDPRFATLGIGLVEGELAGEFDWLGRLKTGTGAGLLGRSLSEALPSQQDPLRYREILRRLQETFESDRLV